MHDALHRVCNTHKAGHVKGHQAVYHSHRLSGSCSCNSFLCPEIQAAQKSEVDLRPGGCGGFGRGDDSGADHLRKQAFLLDSWHYLSALRVCENIVRVLYCQLSV